MGENPKFWIVLVSKVPQGPYTEEQIKALLNQNKFRRNEVGMQVSEDGSIALSGWKILWQFPEFDRRLNKKQVPLPTGQERRKTITSADIEQEKREKIPQHLLDINPEELLLGQKEVSLTFTDRPDEDAYGESSDERPGRRAQGRMSAFSTGLIALFLVVGAIIFFQGAGPKTTAPTAAPVFERAPAQSSPSAERAKMPLSNLRPRQRPIMRLPQATAPVDAEGDSGEMSQGAYDEVQEEEALREEPKVIRAPRTRKGERAVPLNEEFYDDEESFPEEESEGEIPAEDEEEASSDVEYYD